MCRLGRSEVLAVVVCLLIATTMVVVASAMAGSSMEGNTVASAMASSSMEGNTVERATQTKDLLNSLATSHLRQGTYLIFGTGRRSERDLPVCNNTVEACNLVHKRYWFTPITERFCRCEDRSVCPLYFTNLTDPNAQHVSNRAQLQFCGKDPLKDIKECGDNEQALEVRRVEREKDPFSMSKSAVEGYDTRSRLLCRCPWPHRWDLQETKKISSAEMHFLYTCQKLPECRRYEVCGSIREDTLESYYTCSCPVGHLCVFPGHPAVTHKQSNLHFNGEAYTASCLPK